FEKTLSFVLHTKGMGGIVDHLELMLASNGVNDFHITGTPEYMHRYNGACVGADLCCNRSRIDTPALRINIGKDWLQPFPLQRTGCSYEGKWRGNDLPPVGRKFVNKTQRDRKSTRLNSS